MGHVEPDGAAAEAGADIWALWGRLKRYFPTWSLLPSSLYTPGAWGYMGVDFISGFRRNRSTHQAFELLDGVDDGTFDAISALANLNARRQEQMLRAVIIAVLAEVAGDSLIAFVRDNLQMSIQFGAGATLAPLSYFLSHWRSRQIVSVLDLIRIERGQSPYTALELRPE